MEFENMFAQCNFSIDELNAFRDSEGFIDLSKAGIRFTPNSREIIGNPNRVKNWVNFNGQKALVKGEAILESERNYGIYGELIAEEVAKKLGLETAHYDLIKSVDENGKTFLGVLTESMVDINKGERLESLRSIIGDEPVESGQFIDMTSLDYTLNKLQQVLTLDGVSQEQIDQVLLDYKKRLTLSIATLDTDKHVENIAFIRRKVDGQETIKLSPNFDSEASFLLDTDISTIKKLLDDYEALKQSANVADPRIGTLVSRDEGGLDSVWMDTLEMLCEDDEIYDFYADKLEAPLDMDEIFENVEKRIHAKIPEDAKLLAKYTYKTRNEDMQKVMSGEILDQEEQEQSEVDFILQSLIGRGLGEQIRTQEQLDMGNSMERDIFKMLNLDKEQGLDK